MFVRHLRHNTIRKTERFWSVRKRAKDLMKKQTILYVVFGGGLILMSSFLDAMQEQKQMQAQQQLVKQDTLQVSRFIQQFKVDEYLDAKKKLKAELNNLLPLKKHKAEIKVALQRRVENLIKTYVGKRGYLKDRSDFLSFPDKHGDTLLHWAVDLDLVDQVMAFFKLNDEKPEPRILLLLQLLPLENVHGDTPLLIAIKKEDAQSAKALLEPLVKSFIALKKNAHELAKDPSRQAAASVMVHDVDQFAARLLHMLDEQSAYKPHPFLRTTIETLERLLFPQKIVIERMRLRNELEKLALNKIKEPFKAPDERRYESIKKVLNDGLAVFTKKQLTPEEIKKAQTIQRVEKEMAEWRQARKQESKKVSKKPRSISKEEEEAIW